jgi:hypothetical protein
VENVQTALLTDKAFTFEALITKIMRLAESEQKLIQKPEKLDEIIESSTTEELRIFMTSYGRTLHVKVLFERNLNKSQLLDSSWLKYG